MPVPLSRRALTLSLLVLPAAFAACARAPASEAPAVADVPDGELPLKLAPRPTVAAITPADLMTRLYVIADDSMEGRLSGSAGGVRATAYLAGELQRIGLVPAGDGGTWFQTLPYVLYAADTIVLELAGAPLTRGVDFQPYLAAGNVSQGVLIATVRARDARVLYGGRLSDPAAPPSEQSAGAVVILAPSLDTSGAAAPVTAAAVQEAARRHPQAAAIALAALDQYSDAQRAAMAGPVRTMANPNRVTSGRPGMFFLTTAAAGRLLGRPLAGAAPGTRGGLVSATITFAERALDAAPRNVVALLPGGDPAFRGQYVALGAHSDHVGIRQAGPVEHDSLKAFNRVLRPQGAEEPARAATEADRVRIRAMIDSMRARRAARPDSIFNGADDDGSGTVALLEIAEALASRRPRPARSVLFVWHAAEEQGMVGANWFTRHPTVPLDSIVAQINLDMVGRGRAEDTPGGGPRYLQLLGARRLSSAFGALVDSVARSAPHGLALDDQFDAPGHPNQFYCRSDHAMYARFGIPIVFFSTGGHQDYHMVTDEPQYIDYRHLARVTAFVRDLTVAVANRPQRPALDGPKPDPEAPCRQ